MKCIKSIIAAAFVLAAGTAFAAKPLEGKHFTMAIVNGFPPFEYEEINDKGESVLVGFDVAWADAIAESLGFTYDPMIVDFKGLIGAVVSGRADFVISAISANDERRKSVDFSIPYYYSLTSIVQHKGTNIKHVDDMKGKKIAATFGTENAIFAGLAGAEVVAMESAPICMQELLAGRADGFVQDAAAASLLCKQHPDELEYYILPEEEIAAVDSKLASLCFSAVFPKGSELVALFDEQINAFEKDGTTKAIYEKWIGPWPYKD